jgi:dihydrofolate synthase/folylpolyglutamate synthase
MLDVAGAPYRTSLAEATGSLPRISLPGRFQRIGKFVLDVAHNPDGIRALVSTLDSVKPARPVVAVLGVLRDKDWREIMRSLCPEVDSTILTTPASAPAERVWDAAEALKFGADNGWSVALVPDVAHAVERAATGAATVVVTGSFHTVGDASLHVGLG